MTENVTITTCVSENELVQIRREQVAAGAKLSLDFAFGTHPHVFNVLCVNVTVGWVYKVLLVYDHLMCVDPAADGVDVGVRRSTIGDDVAAGQNVESDVVLKCCSRAIRHLNQETLSRPPFYPAEYPVPFTPLPSVIFSVKVFCLIDFHHYSLPVVIYPPNFSRIPLDPIFTLIPKEITPVHDNLFPGHSRFVCNHCLRRVMRPQVHHQYDLLQSQVTAGEERSVPNTLPPIAPPT